jgi:DNA helicase TIP49 (TBP-interacting protein)
MKPTTQRELNTTCIYCGYEIRTKSNMHKECEKRHQEGLLNIKNQTKKYLTESGDIESLEWMIRDITVTSYISSDEQNKQIKKGFEEGILELLKESEITIEIKERIDRFKKHFLFLAD